MCWYDTIRSQPERPPLQKQLKLKEEDKEMTLAEEVLMMKSTPLCIAWREEKLKEIEEKRPMVVLVIPMLQRLTKEGLQYAIVEVAYRCTEQVYVSSSHITYLL